MADLSIDVSLYTRAPRISTTNGLSLAQQLRQEMPAEAPPSVVTAGDKLANSAHALGAAFGVEVGATPLSPRLTDVRLDRVWGAVEGRVSSWSVLTDDVHRANRERAAELHQKFFGEGLLFLTFEYMSEHAESQKRINWIVGEVETDLLRLVGVDELSEPRLSEALRAE